MAKSRATRAAAQAAKGAEKMEVVIGPGIGQAAMGDNGNGPKPQPKPAPKEAAAKPELPVVQWDLGAYTLIYHKPTITMPGGEVIHCPHSKVWGHESEKATKQCLRQMAGKAGVKLA